MNKIDKFLYGGFAAVALVGFVAVMLVSVFSPLKQSAKETAQPLPPPQTEPAPMKTIMPDGSPMPPIPDGYVGYWVDDDGTLVYVTQEEIDEGKEELKRKEAEEAERIAREKAKKEWWASRQDWIDRFPFEPTYHPEITFDPDETDRKMRDMVENHSFLRSFYESKLRYTKEFEQLHDIVQEVAGEEKADNPIVLAKTFRLLQRYHQTSAQDPEAIYRENAEVAIRPQPKRPEPPPGILDGLTPQQLAAYKALPGAARREMTAELRYNQRKEFTEKLRAYHAMPKYEVRDITWGEEAETLKRCIIGRLMDQMEKSEAEAIRERLLDEIPAEGFLKMGRGGFISRDRYIKELKPGDPLLIK